MTRPGHGRRPDAAVAAAAAARARAVAIPAWVWLAGIVAASVVVRAALAHRIVAPWIMVDELVYSELAKSFAASGDFLVRGVPSHGYGFVYPVLLSPAWRAYSSVPDAYAAAKVVNSVVMSLAAVPAYFLARRLVSRRLALAVAALTVLVPSMLYTGTLMTENAFYPLFLTCVLALVAMLERPTAGRQVLVLALCALAYATRQQAVALFPAAVCAPLLHAPRRLRQYLPLYAIVGAGIAAALLATAARGRSPLELLGAYRAATSSSYSVGGVLRFLVYHLGELDLYLGVLPFAALLALWLAPGAARAFAAATFPVFAFLVVEVAAFASQPSVDKIEERNLFYLAPVALTALVALPRPRRAALAAGAAAGVLPVFVDYPRFIDTKAVADTFALLPWWWVQDHWIHLDEVRWAALGVSLSAAALFALVPRRSALVLPALVGAYFVLTTLVVENGRHGIHQASLGKLWAGIRVPHPDWIDRAVGADASVAILRTSSTTDETVWENEFFNRSVRTVYFARVDRVPDPLPERELAAGARVRYVLAEDAAGTPVARDPGIGVTLYRVDGPLVIPTRVRGVYADTWSGRRVAYERRPCGGGTLTVTLGSDPSLFARPQVVTATQAGRVAGRVAVPPAGRATLVVPLEPRSGACSVRFGVARTKVPGHGDTRRLGAHFLSFSYSP
ncbi:MAG TPA: glycosyltransferase family 39 protein [Gaiellaceae bacterium]|nr:glycosyltransferase family 39 protein [Gaiellaceae bacterium]